MFVKLNDRTYLNKDRITRIKVDSVQDGIRIRFYEGQFQVAKSGRFESEEKAMEWLQKNFIGKQPQSTLHSRASSLRTNPAKQRLFVMRQRLAAHQHYDDFWVCAFKKSLRKYVAVKFTANELRIQSLAQCVNRRCSYANKVYDDIRSPNLLEKFHHLNPANYISRSVLLIVPIQYLYFIKYSLGIVASKILRGNFEKLQTSVYLCYLRGSRMCAVSAS